MVSVAVRVRLVPTFRTPNFKLPGNRLATVPVPVSEIVCGLLEASSVIVTEPVSMPTPRGVKVALMVQLEPAAR